MEILLGIMVVVLVLVNVVLLILVLRSENRRQGTTDAGT